MPAERLQKILAHAGYGSRRANEEIIRAGRVSVNGQVAELGAKADPVKDAIRVDGKRIDIPEEFIYIAIYKPRGVLSTTAGPDPRQKVTDLVPGGQNLHMVGRLDKDSEGLMLLTNDGELTQRLSHPRYEQEKEYRVLVARHPDQEQLGIWRRGVVLEDGTRTRSADVRINSLEGKGAWLRVVMHEGHKRQIREIARLLGLPVVKLMRVRIASLRLGLLKPGEFRKLTTDEVKYLKSDQPKPVQRRSPRPKARTRPPASGRHAPPSGPKSKPGSRRPPQPGSARSKKPFGRRPSNKR